MSSLLKDPLIIELQYLPSIPWFAAVMDHEIIYIDACEHFEKGSYRNRCHILGPNGLLRLSIPLVHGKQQHKKIDEVLISYDQDWQKIHWMTLCSCYRRSAYFEYFEDIFYPFYHKRFELLYEFNSMLLEQVLKILDVKKTWKITDSYLPKGVSGYSDMRSAILPNIEPPYSNETIQYTQVFSDRFEFIPNLSIIDHIFNNGSKAIQ